jgi:serine phosphatase RsbU (regulator of sigma subunit)
MARILVIDDEQIIRKRMKSLLDLDGYETFTAGNGQEGLEIFRKENPEIALVDIKMPGMDGIEVLEKIKEETREKTRGTDVIIITGHGGVDTAIQALKKGAFGYIQKPIDYDELEIEINKALERQELKKSLDEHVHNLEHTNAQLKQAVEKTNQLYAVQKLQNEKLKREYEIASNVFSKVMHSEAIECTNMRYLLASMDVVGGDHVLCAPKPSGGMYTFLGDFTGHGLSAAIGAIPVADTFYAMTDKNFSICDIVAEINHKLKATLPSVIFLAACFTELNYEKGTLTVWNGGIPDMLVIGKNGGIKNRLPSRHLPLGVVDNTKLDLDVEICDVEEGDRIYIYSDGVIETSNPNEEMFGQERFEEFFQNKYDQEGILDKIRSDLETFRGDAPQQDDITVVEITCAPSRVRSLEDESTRRQKAAYDGWNLSLKFDAETLRTIDVPSFLIKMIEEDMKLHEHKENIYLIMKELVTNALEHGLLKLPSDMKKSIEGFEQYVTARQEALDALGEGWIKVDLEFFPIEKGGKLLVRVEDTGPGFNYQQRLSDLADNVSFSGRGIPLVRSISKEVTFHGNGNRVQAVYEF